MIDLDRRDNLIATTTAQESVELLQIVLITADSMRRVVPFETNVLEKRINPLLHGLLPSSGALSPHVNVIGFQLAVEMTSLHPNCFSGPRYIPVVLNQASKKKLPFELLSGLLPGHPSG